jgi:hypothetical protein
MEFEGQQVILTPDEAGAIDSMVVQLLEHNILMPSSAENN